MKKAERPLQEKSRRNYLHDMRNVAVIVRFCQYTVRFSFRKV